MKYLVGFSLKVVLLFYLILLNTGCSEDWLDLDLDFDQCMFYSYIDITETCECLNNGESNCEVFNYMLNEKEYERINALFDESENECLEVSGVDFTGKNFSGMSKRPFVDYCHKFFQG
ncbi:hypothetical protein NE848_08250 [Gramella jeungdoensis]|uniref:Lipoprotein n=1 Tax=Gramella jeungdoensis TaxID=708091 RepID=A0ABT0Z2L0_9FLAO|nr:hypothetical protein [Gramella jeungdoensis]MCM8569367.1 hypothetical protein [Gramella jeungdoensis]